MASIKTFARAPLRAPLYAALSAPLRAPLHAFAFAIAFALTFAALTVSTSTAALAHTDKDHAKKAGPVKKEQKAWGIAADAKAAKRTIEITMTDNMRFTPDRIDVKQGETVRIVIKNQGKMLHEFVLGTKKELEEHAALMLKFPTMEHSEPYMAHVAAGKTGDIVWTFNRAGEFDFACLIAGHYQAGMVGKLRVAAAAGAGKTQRDGHSDHKH